MNLVFSKKLLILDRRTHARLAALYSVLSCIRVVVGGGRTCWSAYLIDPRSRAGKILMLSWLGDIRDPFSRGSGGGSL
jgi:hypothetical protein